MLDWLIVGGGIHGTHLSLVLRSAGVPERALRVLDPWDEPMERWRELTERTGMTFLRSPGVHHVGLDPYDLFRFAGRRRAGSDEHFRGRYRRPSLAIFQAHAQALAREEGLDGLRVKGRALGLTRTRGGLRVETETGNLDARRVVLAPGSAPPDAPPPWIPVLEEAGVPVAHLFQKTLPLGPFRQAAFDLDRPVLVLGGGLTAVQLALRLGREGIPVILLARTPLRVHAFDSDPGWLGPKFLQGFWSEPSPEARRALIVNARNRGSVPEWIAGALRVAAERQEVRVEVGAVCRAQPKPGGGAVLTLEQQGDTVEVAGVLLATGWGGAPPLAPWLGETARELGLPLSPCGFPVPEPSLLWGGGIHLSGALAELEVGPAARNIIGARMAGERLRDFALHARLSPRLATPRRTPGDRLAG